MLDGDEYESTFRIGTERRRTVHVEDNHGVLRARIHVSARRDRRIPTRRDVLRAIYYTEVK